MLAQLPWTQPDLDYFALAPEIVLAAVICGLLLIDLFLPERSKWALSTLAGLGLLASFVPIVLLAVSDDDVWSMFGGAYVVDDFALVLKALFVLSAYVIVLMSTNYIEEGEYYQGEYYFLLVTAVLGMVMMSSSRDLISIFVALEFLSIPAYMLAAWRKRDLKSNEAGVKYYLLGVFSSAVMLYGMSLFFGVTNTTLLVGINQSLAANREPRRADARHRVHHRRVRLQGVGGALPLLGARHLRGCPHTGRGLPLRSSKAAGFVALVTLIFVGFLADSEVWEPAVLGARGADDDGRQPHRAPADEHRAHARLLLIAQGGYILVPFAVAGDNAEGQRRALHRDRHLPHRYAAMNLGAFAVVIAVARKTRSGDIDSYGGLFNYAPALRSA